MTVIVSETGPSAAPWKNRGPGERAATAVIVSATLAVAAVKLDASQLGPQLLLASGLALALSQAPTRLLLWARLLTGAFIAVTGTLLTLQLGLVLNRGGTDDDGLSSLMIIALGFGVFAAWCTEHRIAAAREAEAAERHAELLAAVAASRVARRPRLKETVILVAALLIARRKA